MKFVIIIPLMMVCLLSKAQHKSFYKLDKSSGLSSSLNRFFSLKVNDTTIAPHDTVYRVARIVYANSPAIAYKIRITRDSLKYLISISDSAILDTGVYAKLNAKDSLKAEANVRIFLIKASDMRMEYPIEALYQFQSQITISTKVASHFIDSIKKEKPIKISGNITVVGQYSDGKYLYQTIPNSYVRTYVNVNADVFGLPFSTGYYYTTESNSGVNKINNFRLSFDYNQFHANLKNKLSKKLEISQANRIKQFTSIDINALNAEVTKIQEELKSVDYQKRLNKYQTIVALGEVDTTFRNTYKYKRALAKDFAYRKKLERLQELEKQREDYLRYSKMADVDMRISVAQLNRAKDFNRAIKKYGFVKPGQSIFLSVKKLDIGTFDPDYTKLVLSGVSLTGVNVELNPGYAYGAFTWGKAVANFDNPLKLSSYAGGRNIISGRVGVGNKEKFLLAISILKGSDDSGNQVKDSLYDYYLPNYNYVIGLDASYRINENAVMGIEYAKSKNEAIGNAVAPSIERIGNLFSPAYAKYANAYNAFTNLSFKENTTRFKFMARMVDPFYYSFGTPYLRRDNFRIEAKGEQLFWKKQLTIGVTYRRDADNIRGLKQGTSTNNSFIYNMQIRIKKYPYLLFTYSPNYQTFFNSVADRQIQSQVKFYNVILGYVYQSQKIVANTTMSYVKQYNKSNQAEWQAFDVNQYSLVENVNIMAIGLTLNGGIAYTLPLMNADTGKIFSATISATKNILKNKATITAGGRYVNDYTLEERYIAEVGSGFNLGFGINCQIQIERHFITQHTTLGTNKDMFLGRITLIKSF